jgi:hypothetical protein
LPRSRASQSKGRKQEEAATEKRAEREKVERGKSEAQLRSKEKWGRIFK